MDKYSKMIHLKKMDNEMRSSLASIVCQIVVIALACSTDNPRVRGALEEEDLS